MKSRLVEHGELLLRSPEIRSGDLVLIDTVDKHLSALGPCRVIHDDDSRWVHVDLFVCEPTGKPFTVIATCGMSERPLTTVTGERVWTELICILPDDWPLDSLGQRESFWPFSLLRWLARFPHQTGTGFKARESVGPIAHTPDLPRVHPFEGAVFLAQKLIPRLVMVGREIEFLAICPIYSDELAWIRREGTSVLFDAFAAEEESPYFMWAERPSYAPDDP